LSGFILCVIIFRHPSRIFLASPLVFREGRTLKDLILARNIAKENNESLVKVEDFVISAFTIKLDPAWGPSDNALGVVNMGIRWPSSLKLPRMIKPPPWNRGLDLHFHINKTGFQLVTDRMARNCTREGDCST